MIVFHRLFLRHILFHVVLLSAFFLFIKFIVLVFSGLCFFAVSFYFFGLLLSIPAINVKSLTN